MLSIHRMVDAGSTGRHSEHSLNLNATDADASAAATGALPCIGAHQRRT